MKTVAIFMLLALAAPPAQAVDMNPITRVAELLTDMAAKIDADSKAEEKLYTKFKCWCKSVIGDKSATIAAAATRIEELDSYIDSLTSGRVELTSEKDDLDAQHHSLKTDIEASKDMRASEKADFEAAKDEMEKSIAALESAVKVMGDGTKGALVSFSSEIRQAITTGSSFLKADDAHFLNSVLSDPNDPDWKKLNRKATFKSKYTKRSGKIQDILADMLTTFKKNLADAEAKEKKTVADFEKLMKAKGAQLDAVEKAQEDMSLEKGARAKSLADSQAELDENTQNKADDERFKTETEKSCKEKAEAWSNRKKLRAEEIAGINEAISILRSDDARDTFKKSFESQSFVQLKSSCSSSQDSALEILRKTAVATHNMRLLALTTTLRAGQGAQGHFDKVIGSIDQMIADLNAEEDTDLTNKENCETDREENTQTAKIYSKDMDTADANVEHYTANVEEKKEQIKASEEEIASTEDELAKATRQREDENTNYKNDKQDDKDAKELVGQAIKALAKFYENRAKGFLQQPAGEAPPPPPATFEGGYAGSKGENDGVVAILEIIEDDIAKDIARADAEEKASLEAFKSLKKDSEATIAGLQDKITSLDGEVGNLLEKIGDEKGAKADAKKSLTTTVAFLQQIAPGCDFIAVNFEQRLKNRQAEIDGLNKAKAILSGAAFPQGPDPSREMKPGDAFLQKPLSVSRC